MAITERTLRLVREMRASLDRIVDATTRDLTKAWVRAWDELIEAFNAAADDLISATINGRWPSRVQVNRSKRVERALDLAARSLGDLALKSSNDVAQAAWQAVHLAVESTPPILLSQMPTGHTSAGIRFDRLDEAAVEWIVNRTTQQINARHWPLAADATDAMRRELVRGVVVGDNPKTAARNMVKRCEGAFNGGLARAANIARTEMLDAHRAGAQAAQDANADALAGWLWMAKLDTRTCPSCWSQHGKLHPLSEPGPLDHQSGRCARTPKTKSWAELGFVGLDEPGDVTPDAQAIFDALPREDRLAIMGPARLQMLEDGDIEWADLSTLRTTSGWRDSYHVTPVTGLRRRRADDGIPGEPSEPAPQSDSTPEAEPADTPDPRREQPEEPPPDIGELIPVDYGDAGTREEAIQAAIQAAIKRQIEGVYAGYDVVVNVSFPLKDKIEIWGAVNDANGEQVGVWSRTLHRDYDGKLWAEHSLLELDRQVQGQGLAAAFNRALLAWYRHSGLDRVELHADIDVGGYAWARNGYDWAEEESARGCLQRLDQAVYDAKQELAALQLESHKGDSAAVTRAGQIQTEIEDSEEILRRGRTVAYGADDFPTPYEISQAGRRSGREMWIGKKAMLGSDWQAVKWL